jgi:HD-GYP domain-containing protein (c-di-GMP phosphodiesterase class II)
LFAPLHDIGKIGIPDSILMKPGKLDPEERRIMQTHVDKGVEMVEKIISEFKLGSMSDSSIMRNIVACHHEFLDGSGYPGGLKGDLVPIEARIVTVADIFDALTSRRPYKTNWSVKDALAELTAMAVQGKLDAHCVSALRRSLPEVEAIIVRYPDEDWMSGAA